MGDRHDSIHYLRTTLSRTENSAQGIQSSAACMMKQYDKSPALAVSEWRNALQSCRSTQLLPLLYVANEVLQTSKRNRGNRYLEEFSPVLKASLQFICEKCADVAVVEKVRRTVKIWGDRRVFSVRFVSGLLSALQAYRQGNNDDGNINGARKPTVRNPRFSPMVDERQQQSSSTNSQSESEKASRKNSEKDSPNYVPPIHDEEYDEDDDNDDGSPFGNSGPSLLNVDNITIDQKEIIKATTSSPFGKNANKRPQHFSANSSDYSEGKLIGNNKRRRRSSNGSTFETETGSGPTSSKDGGPSSSNNSKELRKGFKSAGRRRSMMSMRGFDDLLRQLSDLDGQFLAVDGILSSMVASKIIPKDSDNNMENQENDEEDDIMEKVGEELTALNKEVNSGIKTIRNQRNTLFHIAQSRKHLENEIINYLPWLKTALKSDIEEVKFCNELSKKLQLLNKIHGAAKEEREKRRDREAKERAVAEAIAYRKAKEEELKKSINQTLKGKNESKDGMVWNRQLMEYQYLPDATEESWRD
eukprot:CAMPEP_0184869950 /NCGR_PEP_ID=MMETSP0580-20130426/35935_1 /TAXON_ID=1118495 /ORGANISM="Dactyliosolen fragilissimus" /LENGTH=529 /DNA_ID=CAMNT_0027371789 /DNA_START=14 /DNA_END=1603 /DNA_ORIENTATION=+